MRTHAITRQRNAGFSLVELMVAMIAGLIATSGAYYLSASSTRQIGEQMRLSDTQTALRSALDQVRRDFARAGYLGSRNSALLPGSCAAPISSLPNPVTAVQVVANGSLGAPTEPVTGPAVTTLLNTGVNLTRADHVTLQGAYAAGTMFPVTNVAVTPANVITVDDTTTTFRMVFFDAPPGGGPAVYNSARFASLFTAQRAVRFESDGNFYFRRITGTNTALPPTITLDSALPDETCAPRAGAFVSVLSLIEYKLDPVDGVNTPPELLTLNATVPTAGVTQQALGVHRAVLVRRELRYQDGAPLVLGAPPAMALSVVLDNVVEFQVNGVQDIAPPGAMPDFQPMNGPTTTAVSAANPERVRALNVTLSARSMEGDRVRAHMPRASLDLPMFTFQQGAGVADATFFVARVRTMRSEIFLANTVE